MSFTMTGFLVDARGWTVSDRVLFALLVCIEVDLASRLAAVSEMMHSVIREDLLLPLVARYSELVVLLRELRNDRIALASNYGLELVFGFSFVGN